VRLFDEVRVSRFRSIREASLEKVRDFSVLAGLNNSGKSNFLRALNLFFTGETEPGVAFRLDRDYYRPETRSRKKKVIEISVHFDLPQTFRFRSGLESVEEMLGRQFTMTKRWSRDLLEPQIEVDGKPIDRDDSLKAIAFLNLINFRFVPNRVMPTDVILAEQEALRDVLIRRLARQRAQSEEVFRAIREAGQTVIFDMASAVGGLVPGISNVRLDTASSLADLALRFGYQLQEGGVEMDETEQGSGIQSLLMFQTLNLIDRDFFQQFGWRQAAVWVVEEPESSLHTALEAEIARFLAQISSRPNGRLQTVSTTHSDLMIQYADSAYLIEKSEVRGLPSTSTKQMEPRELLRQTPRFGISRWVNPILLYHLEPMILVEGKSDQTFILQGLRMLEGREFRVASLSSLLANKEKGGVETIKSFLKENLEAIRARPVDAKVVVVLDWDSAGKVDGFRSLFRQKDPVEILAWDESEANPMLDASFKGIERFYSDRLIVEVEKKDSSLIATKNSGLRTVQPKDLGSLKQILHPIVDSGLDGADLVYAKSFLLQLAVLAS